jgi:hypothetical protein
MNRQVNVSTWVPLASVQPLDAIGKAGRSKRDGQQGTILYFTGSNVTLQVGGRLALMTLPVRECEVLV